MGYGTKERFGRDKFIRADLTVGGGAYTANDAVGGKLSFEKATRWADGGSSIATRLTITEVGTTQTPALELWVFDRDFTAVANNAAFTLGQSDFTNCIGIILVNASDYKTITNVGAMADIDLGARVFELQPGNTTLYGQLRTTGTPTLGNLMIVRLAVLRD